MTIDKTQDGQKLVIKLAGRLDTTTAPELQQELDTSLDGVTALEFDFSELAYISSAGLRVMLAAHKKMAGKEGMVIKNASAEIMEIFEVTGFVNILSIR